MGQLTGGAIVLLLQFLGIVKCVFLLRRPTTSKLCTLSLLLFLTGWIISSGQVLLQTLGFQSPLVVVLVGLALVVLMVSAVVLGIIGLALYDKNRFHQGRAQAIWAISLSSLMMLAGVGIIISNATKKGDGGGKTGAGNLVETGDFTNGPIKNTKFNFSLAPTGDWSQLKAEAMNKLACLALRRKNPEAYCIVIGEKTSLALDLEQLREIVKSNLSMAAEVTAQTDETVELHGGLKFAHTSSVVRTSGMTLNYEHWVATHRGFSWQIVCWGGGDRSRIVAEARALAESFRILDPALDGSESVAVADVKRPQLGYQTALSGLGWGEWAGEKGNALIDFAALRTQEAVVVIPLPFDGEPPDLDALTRSLLSALDLKNAEGNPGKPWTPGHGGTGREIETERVVDGNPYHYVLRIARGKRCAHLLAGWAVVDKGDLDSVRAALDAISLTESEGPVPPLTPEQKTARGLVLNEAGMSLAGRKEYEAAAACFRQGFEAGNDPTVLGNAGDALENLGHPSKGRELLAPHVARFPSHHYLGLRYARLLALDGDVEAAREQFARLVENGLKDESDLLSWLQLLNGREQYEAALHGVGVWLAKYPSPTVRLWEAQSHSAGGNPTKAIELLEALHRDKPDDVKASLELGSEYNGTGEYAKAGAIAEELLKDGKESPEALSILGWSQMGREWYRDAKTTFERAAKQAPDDPDLQNYIRRASAALGQGDNSGVKEEIAPVAIPSQVAEVLASNAPAADFGEGHPCVWLARATGYHFEKGKAVRRTLHRRVKVLTTEGARDLSSISTTFDPVHEKIFMNRLEVRNAAGEIVAKASVDDAYVRSEGDTASHEKKLHLQVAGVQPGTTVEWEITIEDRGNSEHFRFNRHLFSSGLPAGTETVFVTGDVAAVRSELTNGDKIRSIRTDRLLAWISGELPVAESEPFSILPERRNPMLWIGGEEGSWEEVGKEYLKQIEDRLGSDQAVRELAATLTGEKAPVREKIAAIARHVQKEISYKAIEFGIRARRPNAADETLRLRYGDCKDTAVLTHLLLKAAGVESHLALVSTDWETQAALPTLDQFNHAVLHVPALGKNWLLDPTDKTLDLVAFPADGLWHSRALVLDPAGPRLMERSGTASKDSANVGSRRKVSVKGRDLNVRETVELTGYYASWMRGAFIGLSPAEQVRKAQDMLGEGAARVHEFRFGNVDRVGEPARLELDYDVPEAVTVEEGRCKAAIPALWEKQYLGTGFVKDRKTGFEVIYPVHVTSEVIADIPARAEENVTPASRQDKNAEHCAWKLDTEFKDGGVRMTFDFVGKPGEWPAKGYGTFHDSRESSRRAWDRTLSWAKP